MKVLLILFLLVVSSSSNAASKSEKEAALSWLKIVDSGQYAESWQKTAPFFQNQLTRSQWEKALNQVRAPLGKVLSRQVISTNQYSTLPNVPKGEYVVISIATDFNQKKSATETITISKVGDEWLTVGYFIK